MNKFNFVFFCKSLEKNYKMGRNNVKLNNIYYETNISIR